MFSEPCERIDLRPLLRCPRPCGPDALGGDRVLVVRIDNPRPVSINLVSTPTAFGGTRWWAKCPTCSRRVAVLVRMSHQNGIGCRVCLSLTYETARASRVQRLVRKIARLRRKLGAGTERATRTQSRPRGMWHRTYARIAAQLDDAERALARCAATLVEGSSRSLSAAVDLSFAIDQLPPGAIR